MPTFQVKNFTKCYSLRSKPGIFYITSNNLTVLCDYLESNNQRGTAKQVIKNIVSCWVTVADAVVYCFKMKLTQSNLNHLQGVLVKEHCMLIEVLLHFLIYVAMRLFNY
ncbi:13673_t:CDS:2 [Racocetra fulgida]|uniref:13673_t:CDS:1 n=1 Tax=Racocetra fulgida TaxID=60492 RepID=A0A9N9A0K4_9GLOM|nr:13673_t:CDS:2 [Racocetra fulgida]